MKKVKYRQYYYGGYSEAELDVPDQCTLYEINSSISHIIKDLEEETWTKSYVMLCPTEFEDSILVGNVYLTTIYDIFIINSEIPILDIEDAPKFKGVYSPGYSFDSEIISSVGMLRKLTRTGIEVSNVSFLGWNGRKISDLSIMEFDYNRVFREKYSTDPYLAKLFFDESERIYKYIVNNE